MAWDKGIDLLRSMSFLKQESASDRHFKVINEPWMIYLFPDEKTKISIMRWDLGARPTRSFSEFFDSVSPDTKEKILFHLDFFQSVKIFDGR
jgi:hypothetical protein